jgi:hypothetical protein
VIAWKEAVPGYKADATQAPQRRGFGSVVLLRVAPQSLGGSASMERIDGHVTWHLRAPLENVLDAGEDEDAS